MLNKLTNIQALILTTYSLYLNINSVTMFSCVQIPRAAYEFASCFFCYHFLFQHRKDLIADLETYRLVPKFYDEKYINSTFIPDVNNPTAVSDICQFLQSDECDRWMTCCKSASACCDRHKATPENTFSGTICPRVWDGWSCFDDTPAGQNSYVKCPPYLDYSNTAESAHRICTENGTWYLNPLTNRSWTNYTACSTVTAPTKSLYVGLGCRLTSIALLILSSAIFLRFRELRSQQRIRMHLCFFTSLILSSIITSIWDFAVTQERYNAIEKMQLNVLAKDPAWCKFLYVLLRYTHSCTYFWMFCEGFYLYKLIIHAFETPRNLRLYYVIGWGVSWIPLTLYIAIKSQSTLYGERCWIANMPGFEWIILAPNLFCLIANIFFLLNILRLLTTQLQTHPNEPSNYRRAMKATFFLVPLLGLHWALVVYYVGQTQWYQLLKITVESTQGAIVAIIFCICNNEVHKQIRQYARQLCPKFSKYRYRRKSSTFSATMQCTHSVVPSVDHSRAHETKPMYPDNVAL